MSDHQQLPGRRARAVLLLAGLLYLLGAAAEPFVHVYDANASAGGQVLSSQTDVSGDDAEAPLPHAEAPCLLCVITGPLALADVRTISPHVATGTERVRGPPAALSAPARLLLPQPRAPPHV
jgi:hypothetical protein